MTALLEHCTCILTAPLEYKKAHVKQILCKTNVPVTDDAKQVWCMYTRCMDIRCSVFSKHINVYQVYVKQIFKRVHVPPAHPSLKDERKFMLQLIIVLCYYYIVCWVPVANSKVQILQGVSWNLWKHPLPMPLTRAGDYNIVNTWRFEWVATVMLRKSGLKQQLLTEGILMCCSLKNLN